MRDTHEQSPNSIQTDVLIVGGGIAGLWLLAELRAKGIAAILATDKVGEGQTIASQGIIHGGTKYALTGKVTNATLAIGDMPGIWRDALQGQGAFDLRAVEVLAEHQLLWTSGGIGSRMTGFFASKAMQSRMARVADDDAPQLFQHKGFKGSLYRLDEPVLNVPQLLQVLREQYQDALLAVDKQQSTLIAAKQDAEGYAYQAVLSDGSTHKIQAQQIILTAGIGNESLFPEHTITNDTQSVMQRRPLQMILCRAQAGQPDLPLLYAHALGMSDKPRMTITSHRDQQGRVVWYLGGQPAEQGVGQPPNAVIKATRDELQRLLPWYDLSQLEWATWHVERAEGAQSDGSRPDQPSIKQVANVTVAWPTKLAFAPMLAQQLLNAVLPRLQTQSTNTKQSALPACVPDVAETVWDRAMGNQV